MRTEILPTDSPSDLQHAVAAAVKLLREGSPVALPTETVYGLAADALNPAAAARIFEAKERPLYDPLIVHLPAAEWLERIATIQKKAEALVRQLVTKFWPGPLTLVLPRQSIVPDLITAGQNTVAVRMSDHPVFQAVCETFGSPLAAPSANCFGKVSPTSAKHVIAGLNGRIPLIIDGGLCEHGVESTIVWVRDDVMTILRHGPISEEELSQFGKIAGSDETLTMPGTLKSHYAPQKPLIFLNGPEKPPLPSSRCGLLAWKETGVSYKKAIKLSEQLDLREAAANLYAAMRTLDESDVEMIIAEPVPETGIGKAIMDRLRRAAARE